MHEARVDRVRQRVLAVEHVLVAEQPVRLARELDGDDRVVGAMADRDRRVRIELGLPTVLAQEGGYDLVTIGSLGVLAFVYLSVYSALNPNFCRKVATITVSLCVAV